MSIYVLSLLLLHLLSTSLSVVSGQKAQNQTVYDVLRKHNLPKGILPQGVSKYELNPKTGYFKVHFNNTCQFPVEAFKIRYQPTISGFLKTGRIKRLIGVSVKVLYVWVNIQEVYHDGHEIEFEVGVISEEFSAHRFSESPQCGCGFYCTNGLVFSW